MTADRTGTPGEDAELRARLKALLDEYEFDFTLAGSSEGFVNRALAIVGEVFSAGGFVPGQHLNIDDIKTDWPTRGHLLAERGTLLEKVRDLEDALRASRAGGERRQVKVGDEVWYCPFRTMGERESGRWAKVLKLGQYEFRIDDGREPLRRGDDGGTWLRHDSFGVTWWWDEPSAGGERDEQLDVARLGFVNEAKARVKAEQERDEYRRQLAAVEAARAKAMEGAAPEFAQSLRVLQNFNALVLWDNQVAVVKELDRRADVMSQQAAELAQLRKDLAISRQTVKDMIETASGLRVGVATPAEPQDQGPYDGLTSTATACHNCPTKLPPEWRVRRGGGMSPGFYEYSLVCCMCGRATEWTKDWRGLVGWWRTNNPALPDGTKVPRPRDASQAEPQDCGEAAPGGLRKGFQAKDGC